MGLILAIFYMFVFCSMQTFFPTILRMLSCIRFSNVWIQLCVQSVCKGYQETTKVTASGQGVMGKSIVMQF